MMACATASPSGKARLPKPRPSCCCTALPRACLLYTSFATLVLGMVLLAVGTMGIHIELGRIFGMLGMTPTLTFGIASALATGVLSLGITLLDPLLRWVVAFVLPAFIVLLFYCAKGRVFPDQKVLYRESANDLFIPYRFMATSVTQGLALGIPLGFLSFSGSVSYTHL